MNNRFYKTTFIISIAYLILVSIFLVWHGAWFSPDQFFAAALLLTLIIGRFKMFIRDWSLPITLFLSYDYLRGLVPKLSIEPHILPMIHFDQTLFGGKLPTIWLQSMLFNQNSPHWYDFIFVVLYMSHFIVPMIVGFVFWLRDRAYFKRYSLALLILSYGAFLTYVLFPAMPPWMAGQQGYIPHVQNVMDKVFASFIRPIDLPTFYRFVGANLVAAVPSLHAAYPFLTFLFFLKKIKAKALLLLPYVFGVWFAIVYMGEHYVFDILVGIIYATVTFLIVMNGERILSLIKSLKVLNTNQKEVNI